MTNFLKISLFCVDSLRYSASLRSLSFHSRIPVRFLLYKLSCLLSIPLKYEFSHIHNSNACRIASVDGYLNLIQHPQQIKNRLLFPYKNDIIQGNTPINWFGSGDKLIGAGHIPHERRFPSLYSYKEKR